MRKYLKINNRKSLASVGFEPTHSKITGLKSVALDRSAKMPFVPWTILYIGNSLYRFYTIY